MRFLTFIISFLLSTSAYALNEFNGVSYNQIIKENNNPFILVLWSLDCPPCIKELYMLGELHKTNPDLNLVLVSTDDSSRVDEINKLITKTNLLNVNSWVFSDQSTQLLRYSIDPLWYGDLPRSYLHSMNNKSRQVAKGLLDPNDIISWMKR